MKKIYFIPLVLLLLFSCEQIVLEDNISGETVHLIAPADGANFNSTGITFTWDAIKYGTQYRIQIARPNFQNPLQIISDNIVDTTSFTVQLNVGKYEWRVQGVNSGYETVYSTRSLTVADNEDFQNNSVTLSLPADNLITKTPAQTLSWQPVIGATGYDLVVINSTENTIIDQEQVTATQFIYAFPEGNYTWKVRATNGTQNTLYSARSISIDTTVPNTPVLTAPANQNNPSDNDVTFQWTRTPVGGTTEQDTIYIYKNAALTDLYYSGIQTSPYASTALPDGTYHWYVKSSDAAGNVSQQSSVFTFTLN